MRLRHFYIRRGHLRASILRWRSNFRARQIRCQTSEHLRTAITSYSLVWRTRSMVKRWHNRSRISTALRRCRNAAENLHKRHCVQKIFTLFCKSFRQRVEARHCVLLIRVVKWRIVARTAALHRIASLRFQRFRLMSSVHALQNHVRLHLAQLERASLHANRVLLRSIFRNLRGVYNEKFSTAIKQSTCRLLSKWRFYCNKMAMVSKVTSGVLLLPSGSLQPRNRLSVRRCVVVRTLTFWRSYVRGLSYQKAVASSLTMFRTREFARFWYDRAIETRVSKKMASFYFLRRSVLAFKACAELRHWRDAQKSLVTPLRLALSHWKQFAQDRAQLGHKLRLFYAKQAVHKLRSAWSAWLLSVHASRRMCDTFQVLRCGSVLRHYWMIWRARHAAATELWRRADLLYDHTLQRVFLRRLSLALKIASFQSAVNYVNYVRKSS